MSDTKQARSVRWEQIKRRGIWRFVFLRGVLGWGLACGIIAIIFEVLSRKEEALPWYLVLGLFLPGGFIWGLATWFVSDRACSRQSK